ncbi:MAG: RagB/SusD family nutrient uptake outer membrane protein [Bacteroidales bacterium]
MKRSVFLGYICAALSFYACDNYLDIIPKGESVLNSTDDYLGLLEDMYGFPIDSEWYLSNEVTSYNMELLENYSGPLSSAGFYWDESFDRAKYMTTTGYADFYTSCYSRIAKYNIIVDNMEDAEGPAQAKREGIAQAKILRAYNYFVLINTFAKPYDPATAETDRGIILRSEFDMETPGVQSYVADAYRFIEQDIREALPGLPSIALNTFRPDKSFGYALQAKVHLFKREINQALEASLTAIQEAEDNGNHKLWDMNVEYQNAVNYAVNTFQWPEFMIQYGGPMYSMFRTMTQSLYLTHDYSDAENLYYAFGLNSMSPSPSMIRKPVADLFVPEKDLRYTFNMGTMPSRPTAEEGSVSMNNMMNRWNCGGIKLSEVYLMAAECYVRNGKIEQALSYLNQLRKNRIITALYTDLTATSLVEAMTLIREERKRELMLTLNSFFDMRRFCSEFNETLTKKVKGKTYTLSPDSHLLVYPFPVAAMQNSNLIQNSK